MPSFDAELILFDLDGTLVDSVPDLAFCVDGMMERLGLPPPGEAKVRLWVGNGVEKLVERAIADGRPAGGPVHPVGPPEGGEPEGGLFAKALPLFMDLYGENLDRRSRLFPGVREGLATLAKRGFRLACVTNKSGRFTEPLLAGLGIRDRFGIVVSGDTLPQKKPHPAPLLHAADFFKVPPQRALMVGDSRHDVEAARAAGLRVVCVGYGYNHGEDIRGAAPDAVIDSFAELPSLLERAT